MLFQTNDWLYTKKKKSDPADCVGCFFMQWKHTLTLQKDCKNGFEKVVHIFHI